MKNFSHFIYANLICIFSAFPIISYSQIPKVVEGELGVFNFNIPINSNWTSTPITFKKVEAILNLDGVKQKPSFAFESKKGGLIFGTWKEHKPGVIFTASQLNSEPPAIPQEWGILKNNLKTSAGKLMNGVEFSEFNITGLGDGKTFAKGKLLRTHGKWIDLPLTYVDSSGLHTGLASLYYRGLESDAFGPPGGVTYLLKILEAISIKSDIKLISVDEYKFALSQPKDSIIQTVIDKPKQPNETLATTTTTTTTTATAAATAVTAVTEINNLQLNLKPEGVIGLLIINGNLSCYNNGIVKPLPCNIPAVNGAEIDSDSIKKINSLVITKK
jgi:hypothetical protein